MESNDCALRAVPAYSCTPAGVRGGAASSPAPSTCRDSERCHTPVPARMCPTTSPGVPRLAAARPCETTIVFQAV